MEREHRRLTGKAFLRLTGHNPSTWTVDALMKLGRDAARIGAARGLVGVKVREDGFSVHTWPEEVWVAAIRGEEAPARPASQRQIAWLTSLAIARYGLAEGTTRVLDQLGGDSQGIVMDEDRAAELIKRLKP